MKVIERLFELQELELGAAAGSAEGKKAAEALKKEIPEPILGHYRRLMDRGKKGVALVRHGVCSGCMMRLATGIHAALRRDEDIAMCDTCARYLLLAPEEAHGAAEAPAPAGFAAKVPKTSVRRGRRKNPPAAGTGA
ncbi:MAG TPA: C4-type zinc ribbon domain-containing protein [Verrucomicrobiota bacterium]|nr:C4-type zinc ribbon domain-containing protein [Verrucomicrobiota bacterium]HNU49756.1 C4-type zinc ribbon domain-containing protein [Verrucomicrobiota bacterium]